MQVPYSFCAGMSPVLWMYDVPKLFNFYLNFVCFEAVCVHMAWDEFNNFIMEVS